MKKDEWKSFSCDGCWEGPFAEEELNYWEYHGGMVLCKPCYRTVRRAEIITVLCKPCYRTVRRAEIISLVKRKLRLGDKNL